MRMQLHFDEYVIEYPMSGWYIYIHTVNMFIIVMESQVTVKAILIHVFHKIL